jgi:uncharacterized protein with HEPN domain
MNPSLSLCTIHEAVTYVPNSLEAQFKSVSWLELINRRNIVRVHCAIFVHIWSQLTGTNAMMSVAAFKLNCCRQFG